MNCNKFYTEIARIGAATTASVFTTLAVTEGVPHMTEFLDRVEAFEGQTVRMITHLAFAGLSSAVYGGSTALIHLALFGTKTRDMSTKDKILKTVAVAAVVTAAIAIISTALGWGLAAFSDALSPLAWKNTTVVNLGLQFIIDFLPALSASAVMSKMRHHPHAA